MTPGPWQRMDLLARQLMPSMLTLVLVIINVVPLHIPGLSRVAPLLPLMAVYHWAAFRPRLLPAYAVFLIGLFQDILTGAPIGVNAFVFLAVYGAVLSQKRFLIGKSFFILWLGFALIAAVAWGINHNPAERSSVYPALSFLLSLPACPGFIQFSNSV